MKDMHGLIFAYRGNLAIKELSTHRAVGSIPFGGKYRIIDFMLSNMVNAGVTDVGVIMRESYQSLLDHLGSGKDWDISRKRGGLRLLPPFGLTRDNPTTESYKGRMDALARIYTYVNRIKQNYVVLADEDILINIDLEEVLREHRESKSDITVVCAKDSLSLPENNTYLEIGEDGFISEVIIRPREPGEYMAMGIYILEKQLLLRLINYCSTHKLYSLEEDVLQKMSNTLRIKAHIFNGYSSKIQTTAAYFGESMKLLTGDIRRSLLCKSRGIKTKVRDDAPTYYSPESLVENSIVAEGCYIEGTVKNCIVFRGVRVEKGAVVSNSILMQDTIVSSEAMLDYAIMDKNVFINRGRRLMGHETYPITIAKGAVI